MLIEEMQVAVDVAQVVAIEIIRALFAQPFADIEMVVEIDLGVVAEVFAPSELRG